MWKEEEDLLKATYTFENFKVAFSFMTQVAIVAEKHDHHPFWTNVYNKVSFELCTHDAGNKITDKDRSLAKEIDLIYAGYIK